MMRGMSCLSKESIVTARSAMAVFLSACWVVAAFLLTFIGPFSDVGNGYLAVLVGAFCACNLVFGEHDDTKREDTPDQNLVSNSL